MQLWVEEEVEDKDKAADEAVAVARGEGRAAWVAQKPPDRAATASAPTAGTGWLTKSDSPVTKSSAPSAAQP
ncbi:MAG: hypothetical protein JXM73_16775 [Anaerolineae bacterium]|nr:hypothetical protein [Anaerolineae bacterium]